MAWAWSIGMPFIFYYYYIYNNIGFFKNKLGWLSCHVSWKLSKECKVRTSYLP